MNIAASNAQGIPVPSRMDATTTTDLPPAGYATTPPGDAVEDFGRILSVTVSKDAAALTRAEPADGSTLDGFLADPEGVVPALEATVVAATSDQPISLDLNAILGARIELPKGTGSDPATRAKPTDDAKDPTADDLAAQLAMLSQWAGPTPLVAQAPADEGGTDPDVAMRGIPSLAAMPRAVGTVAAPGARFQAPRADAAPGAASGADAASSATIVAAVDPALVQGVVAPALVQGAVAPALVQGAVAPAAPDVAVFAAARSALPVNPSGVDAATAKAIPSKAVDATRLSSSEGITAAIEKVFNGAFAATASTAPDPGPIVNPFVTQIAAQVSNAQGSLATGATASTAALREPVATPAWSHELGQAAIRMATDDLQHASLRLNPEHLGPLDVQMRIDNGIAHMQFTAAHADTRAALEGSRATLDQMFGDQGLKLGDWSVGNSSANSSFARQFGNASSQGDGGRASTGEVDVPDSAVAVTMRATRPLGLVDTFA